MGRTPSAAADDDGAPTTTTASSYGLAADCPVTWSDDAMLMTSSLCYGDEMTPEPGSVMAERNWRVVPLVALVAAGVLGNQCGVLSNHWRPWQHARLCLGVRRATSSQRH